LHSPGSALFALRRIPHCEEFREGIAEGDGDDLSGGRQSWPDDPDPGVEESPDRIGGRGGEHSKQAQTMRIAEPEATR
jgi:hypothetical protein